jgi:hypothetical protein
VRRVRASAGLLALSALALSAAPAQAGAPTAGRCAATRAHREITPILALHHVKGAPRVFAMQFKQEPRNVVSYTSFRRKIECLIRADVVPHLAHGVPNVVAFDEDIGLMAVGIGSRGRAARAVLGDPAGDAHCSGQPSPCVAIDALSALNTAYAKPLARYRSRFGDLNPLSSAFVAGTDTLARGFMQTFSDLARRYGIYILGSSDQAPFAQSTKRADIASFADPDLPRPRSVFVATSARVYNQVFLWGPRNVRRGGPPMLRNVVATNRKVPLTPIEQAQGFTPGPSTGAAARRNLAPYRLPGTRVRLGFATSLPAFVYGDPPAGTDPCSDTSQYYMRCLDELGANVVMQDEANPGAWTGPDGDGIEQWQPLSWMSSTWRAVSDPSVRFLYNVTPMMVGNLGDLPFDGQSAITQRGGAAGPGCHYIGNAAFAGGEDRPDLSGDAGAKPEFLAVAPWVTPDASRAALRATGAQLAPGSGAALENDYVETALVADLTVPVDRRRPGCVG